jgi:hypothetical protein
MRARIPALWSEGRVDRVRRLLERADTLCFAEASSTAITRLQALTALGHFAEARAVASALGDPKVRAEAAKIVDTIPELEKAWAALDPVAVAADGVKAEARGEAPRAQAFFDQAFSLTHQRAGSEPRLVIHDGMPGDLVGVAPDGSEFVFRTRDVLTAYTAGLAAVVWTRKIDNELHDISVDGRKTLEVQTGAVLPAYSRGNVRQAKARVSSKDEAGPWLDVILDPDAHSQGEANLLLSPDGAWILECRQQCDATSSRGCLVMHDARSGKEARAALESCGARLTVSGNLAIIHGVGGELEAYDMATGKKVVSTSTWSEPGARGHDATTMVMTGGITWVDLLPSAKRLAAAWDGQVYLHALPSRERAPAVTKFKAPGGPLLTFGKATMLLTGEERPTDGQTASVWHAIDLIARREKRQWPADPTVRGYWPGWDDQDFVAMHDDNSLRRHWVDGRSAELVAAGHTLAQRGVEFSASGLSLHVRGAKDAVLWGERTPADEGPAQEPWPDVPKRYRLQRDGNKAPAGRWDAQLGSDGVLRIYREQGIFDISTTCPGRVLDVAVCSAHPLLAVACGAGDTGDVRLYAVKPDDLDLLAVLRTGEKELRYCLDSEGFMEILSGEPEIRARAACVAGNLRLPFAVCREHYVVQGMISQLLRGKRPSYRAP